ncbi:MAG TPA: putative quinol monooxygenase [Candidatus Baltobacteraceae bacterium]|nr:putative quinol monooxygenase [Candidatus Baltobacteraceae bacterium]
MLINAITYIFPDDKADEAERMLRELRGASLAEEGCAGFEVARGNDADRSTFVLFETWRDQAALDAHYETAHFERLGTKGIRTIALERRAVKGTPVV